MAWVNSRPSEIILQNTDQRVDILVVDTNGLAVNATALSLYVTDLGGTVLLDTEFLPTLSSPQRIYQPPGTVGQYYVLWGDPSAAANMPDQTETAITQDLLFRWTVQVGAGNETIYQIQNVRIVSAYVMSMLGSFRLLIDKTAKEVSDNPQDPCYLGYTDWMLIDFLLGGLTYINAYQPYPVWCSLEEFPRIHLQVLFESALRVGLLSQELFAVDTDVESWNDQGNSFVINHATKIANIGARLDARLDRIVPDMKRQYVDIGTVRTQVNGSYRLMATIAGAVPGTTFRGISVGVY